MIKHSKLWTDLIRRNQLIFLVLTMQTSNALIFKGAI